MFFSLPCMPLALSPYHPIIPRFWRPTLSLCNKLIMASARISRVFCPSEAWVLPRDSSARVPSEGSRGRGRETVLYESFKTKKKGGNCLQSAFSRRFVELVVTRTVSQSVRVGTKDAVYENRLHYVRFSNYNGSFRRGHWLKLELKLTWLWIHGMSAEHISGHVSNCKYNFGKRFCTEEWTAACTS